MMTGDENFQDQKELALGDQVGLAGLVNEFRNLPHGAVDGKVLQAHVDRHAKEQSEHANDNADQQQLVPVDPAKKIDVESREDSDSLRPPWDCAKSSIAPEAMPVSPQKLKAGRAATRET